MRGTGRISGALRFGVLIAGLILLQAAWVIGTQPFGGPDESAHYLRALTLVNGQLIAPHTNYPGVLSPLAQAAADRDTTAVLVPTPALAPYAINCGATGQPLVTGSCLMPDANGNFPPLPYLLPAAALSGSDEAHLGLWRMRIASVVPAFAFLLLAVLLLWSGTSWSLLGLILTISPMVLFVASLLNPSGVQITSSVAFSAAGLRVARDPAGTPPWVWLAFAVSGAVAILAGPIGLEFAVFDLAVLALVLGPRGLREVRRRTRPRTLLASGLTLATAAVLALIYTRIAGFKATIGFTPVVGALQQGVDQLVPVLRDSVGTFGALNLPLPSAARWIWWILVLSLLVAGMCLGDRRERRLIVTVTLLGLLFPVLFYAWVDRFNGFGLQGREVLPALTLIPLVAGEVVFRHSHRIAYRPSAKIVLGIALAVVAAFQLYAWWFDVATVSGALGAFNFIKAAAYFPPYGWHFWIDVAVAGAALLIVFAASEALRGVSIGRPRPVGADMLR